MRYIKAEHQDGDSCIFNLNEAGLDTMAEECRALFEEGSLGDSVKFSIIEMSPEEYARLPEFQGW